VRLTSELGVDFCIVTFFAAFWLASIAVSHIRGYVIYQSLSCLRAARN
jgi:hypothetical protein